MFILLIEKDIPNVFIVYDFMYIFCEDKKMKNLQFC